MTDQCGRPNVVRKVSGSFFNLLGDNIPGVDTNDTNEHMELHRMVGMWASHSIESCHSSKLLLFHISNLRIADNILHDKINKTLQYINMSARGPKKINPRAKFDLRARSWSTLV